MSGVIRNKHIVMGVCGGISAYKIPELLRILVKKGASVKVLMTRNAEAFIGKTTFEALSGNPVCVSLFDEKSEGSIRHISWAQEADAVIVAPATANMIGKLANGIADDALSTFMLAVTSPRMICPAMNTNMYENRAVQRNIDILESDGYTVIEPDAGELACGVTGAGRLPSPEFIADRLQKLLYDKDLLNKKILISAGPTIEPIDPVRFISNHSSGKMGYAIAKAAEYRGAEVTLVSGPTSLCPPIGVRVVHVKTADEMAESMLGNMEQSDIIIKVAAVADYKPVVRAEHKIKKTDERLSLHLEKNIDILKVLGERKKQQILVGFAAETQELDNNAQKKLREKNLDLIVGNLVGSTASAFGSDSNKVTLYFPNGEKKSLPIMGKDEVANILLDHIAGKVMTDDDR
ncbi:MAG: bifunctional phosphopantothenoylcysteine decarboxylase/phosphopantothenate--cysteine ligase CoaBC [Desulfobacteraceae bacterium]|nr:MAG: bifunctional phosphopantothenoylcysteine decarboxylase/phosphopantothenate--cysteine ligase CoaBC [Desulfobacteraceae bacterium]